MSQTHTERVAALNEADIFLPLDYIQEKVLPVMGAAAVSLAVVFALASILTDYLLHKSNGMEKKRKVAYQMTNFVANSLLGCAGLYYEFVLQPDNPTVEETIQGFDHYLWFSSFQLGYQFWAIPMGLFIVNESVPMLCHHVTVIIVSSMSGLMTNGFRYYTPFFYGLIEISSVPLAIMNTYKDNPTWIKSHSLQYAAVRLVFAFLFLWCRIYLFVPKQMQFLRDHFLLFSSSDVIPYQIFMSAVWLSSLFLLILQILWASQIVKGLLKFVSGRNNINNNNNNKKDEVMMNGNHHKQN